MTECKLFLIVTYNIYLDMVKSVRGWDVNAVTIYDPHMGIVIVTGQYLSQSGL